MAHPNFRERLDGLTALRGLAASWIVLYHAQDVLPLGNWLPVLGRLVEQGHFAVDLFYMLSGYVLSHVYLAELRTRSPSSVLRFYLFRLSRVYPVHLFALLAVGLMFLGARFLGRAPDAGGYQADTFVQNVLLIQAWVPRMTLNWNYPAWSVSAEWFAYLCFPFLVALVRARWPFRAGLLTLAALALGATVYAGVPGIVFKELARVMSSFCTGVLTYVLAAGSGGARLPRWVFLLSGSSAAAILYWSAALPIVLLLPAFACLVWAVAQGGGSSLPFFASAQLQWLGKISYSLYMTHALIQKLKNSFLPQQVFDAGSPVFKVLVVVGYLGCMLVVAHIVWRYVEEPSRIACREITDRLFSEQKVSRAPSVRA